MANQSLPKSKQGQGNHDSHNWNTQEIGLDHIQNPIQHHAGAGHLGIEKVGVEFVESSPEVNAKQGGSKEGTHHGVVAFCAGLFEPGVDHACHQSEVEVNQEVDVVGDVREAKN